VGWVVSGVPSAAEEAALIVAKSDSTPDEGVLVCGRRRRRRQCADTGNGSQSVLGCMYGGEAGSRTVLAIKRSFCQDLGDHKWHR
jgi:hypothetical protein